jgi:hypothetical protein
MLESPHVRWIEGTTQEAAVGNLVVDPNLIPPGDGTYGEDDDDDEYKDDDTYGEDGEDDEDDDDDEYEDDGTYGEDDDDDEYEYMYNDDAICVDFLEITHRPRSRQRQRPWKALLLLWKKWKRPRSQSENNLRKQR